MNDDKRRHREEKREVKRASHKHARNKIKRVLTEAPEEADLVGEDFGRHRSEPMNGIDHDATRVRAPASSEAEPDPT